MESGPQSHYQNEGKAQKQRGSRCLVLIPMSFGLFCVLLLMFIILQHSLQNSYADLMTEKHQLQNSFNSLSQKDLELETRVKDLTAENDQLQRDFDYLSQKKTELESRVRSLSDELKKEQSKRANVWSPGDLFVSTEAKNWSDSRKYCRDHGADLVIINSEEKQRHISSLVKERAWIGLSDIENEGSLKWVDNSPLKQGFFSPHEPNDAYGIEDCVETQLCTDCSSKLNTWNDLPCSDLKKAVCEK